MVGVSVTDNHVSRARAIAATAHAGAFDKIGVPYFDHVRAVGEGLTAFSLEIQAAGYLHDVIEDTRWTATDLLKAGVSKYTVALVEAVTNQKGVPYEDKLRKLSEFPSAALVKIADNAHNSRPARLHALPLETQSRLIDKYHRARDILWAYAYPHEIRSIVEIVNPSLLRELDLRMEADRERAEDND